MISMFERHVAATPDAEAVVGGGVRLTYAELDALAERVAQALTADGSPTGSADPAVSVVAELHRPVAGALTAQEPVAIAVPPSAAMIAAVLGVLKAGGAYLPLHQAWPPARRSEILREAGVRFAVGALDDTVVAALAGGAPSAVAEAGGAEDALAYVIYTSGSTGTPKGVQVERGNVTALLSAVQSLVPVGPGDTVLCVSPLAFDMSVVDIFLPLCHGGRLVVATEDERLDPHALARLVDAYDVTFMVATPTMLGALVESGWAGRPGLRVGAGGEVLPGPLARALSTRVTEVWNVYGPTETTYAATFHQVTAADFDGPVPLGRPLAGARVAVCDADGNPVPTGETGEIVVGGTGVSRGYLGRPELTAERFTATPDGRCYRTGDLGRLRPDGVLEYLGRADGQVKVNGLRIELGEIESVLAAVPGAGQVAAAVRGDRLAAYCTGAADPAALLAHARTLLPAYMVPAAVTRVAALPLLPNGKTDRDALPWRVALPLPEPADPDSAVPDPVTSAVGRIWQDLLGVPAAPEDDFVDAGGSSLMLYRLRNRFHTEFGVTIPMRDLLDHSTIAQQARLIEKGLTDARR
ncbi:non-ribosomal peptide synthetase [Yinghuangia soli]|uniref:Non-ribosomal peptide synthetase n=1 Tax=Yinghuangia soli TaxID=2908204 RepID=A0AA41PVL4_9ACTN|nr:non-ribosomal peptide synthetase [Yinghuangia soli]MCF2526703.1 non-ribosomal peptide synthetase [Yinghuangia soli]